MFYITGGLLGKLENIERKMKELSLLFDISQALDQSLGIREVLAPTLQALEEDHDFLMKGDVFTDDAIFTWIDYKREHEVDPIRLRPHPYEFALYYDI